MNMIYRTQKAPINCLVYDEHPIVCESMKLLVNGVETIDNIKTATTYHGALALIKAQPFNILVMDIDLEKAEDLEFYKRIKTEGYAGSTLFVSSNTNEHCSRLAFQLGADGYVTKYERTSTILSAIEGIICGYSYFKGSTYNSNDREFSNLSKRENTVLNYLLAGYNNKSIAQILELSEKTVSTYKTRILKKRGVRNVIELINNS